MGSDTLDSLSQAGGTFLFIFAELTLLFISISYLIGMIQSFIPPEKIRTLLSNKRSYAIAALLGAITPFCSCSTIPFLKGLIRAGTNFGAIIVFLLASPLLNPIIIGLFFVSFGLKAAIYYFASAMLFSILAGLALDKLGFGKYLQPHTSPTPRKATFSLASAPSLSPADSCCSPKPSLAPSSSPCCTPKPVTASPSSSCCSEEKTASQRPTIASASKPALQQAFQDFRQALPYMLIGTAIGAIIYGFVPDTFISRYASADNPLAIPFSAIIGVPLYVRAEAVIPISLGLVEKGMSLGAAMAFIIGSAGASITEVILLKSIFKQPIIIAFLVVVFTMAIATGYLLPLFV
ncbi:permease [Pelagicoccus mobilis]|uniref:permease n=1 Tax=Pelagicoccus mobilis TaxID=415221 RepID=UPI0035EFC1B6